MSKDRSVHYETIILGAGLAGVSAGLKLEAANHEFLILEARDYIGGRVLTRKTKKGNDADLGVI